MSHGMPCLVCGGLHEPPLCVEAPPVGTPRGPVYDQRRLMSGVVDPVAEMERVGAVRRRLTEALVTGEGLAEALDEARRLGVGDRWTIDPRTTEG